MSTKPKPSSGPLDISDRIKARDLRRDDLLARIGIRTPGPECSQERLKAEQGQERKGYAAAVSYCAYIITMLFEIHTLGDP